MFTCIRTFVQDSALLQTNGGDNHRRKTCTDSSGRERFQSIWRQSMRGTSVSSLCSFCSSTCSSAGSSRPMMTQAVHVLPLRQAFAMR